MINEKPFKRHLAGVLKQFVDDSYDEFEKGDNGITAYQFFDYMTDMIEEYIRQK